MSVQLFCGDCLEVLPTLADKSIDAVITDLPYFETVANDWDNQWETRDDYIAWIGALANQWRRVTKDNGCFFTFADEKMEAYVQIKLDEYFLLLNKLVWFKKNNLPQKNAHLLRSFAPMTERALYYGNHSDATSPSGFARIIKEARNRLGLSAKEVAERGKFYGNVNHGGIVSNWETGYSVPSIEQWEKLTEILSIREKLDDILQEHGNLRKEYESLRRPFNADSKTWDVIEWAIIGGGENTDHPTTKPLGLMKRIVSVITDPDDIVLDCCMGSGTTGVAAVKLGRNFIGIEQKPEYFAIAQRRIAEAELQPALFAEPAP